MQLSTLWRALVRRWYLTVVVLLGTVALTYAAASTTGKEYRTEGAILVFPPSSTITDDSNKGAQGNPYLLLAGLNQARDIVLRTLTTRTAVTEFGERHPGSKYEAVPDFTTSGPVIVLTVTSATSAEAVSGLQDLTAAVPVNLKELQDGLRLRQDSYITSRLITSDSEGEIVRTKQIRTAVGAAGLGGFLGLLFVGLLDGLLTSRRRRKHQALEKHAPGQDADDSADDDT